MLHFSTTLEESSMSHFAFVSPFNSFKEIAVNLISDGESAEQPLAQAVGLEIQPYGTSYRRWLLLNKNLFLY